MRVLDPIVDAEPDAQLEWFRWAISHAATGDRTAYRRACRRLRDRYGRMGHPAVAERTAKACLLLALSRQEVAEAARLADVAVANGKEHWVLPYARMTRSLAAYREGDLPAALSWADLCLSDRKSSWDCKIPAHLVRSMALARLGRPAEARDALAKAEDIRRTQPPKPGTPEYAAHMARPADLRPALRRGPVQYSGCRISCASLCRESLNAVSGQMPSWEARRAIRWVPMFESSFPSKRGRPGLIPRLGDKTLA